MSPQSSLMTFKSSIRLPISSHLSQSFVRYASLNSAIGRGIRRSQRLDRTQTVSKDKRDPPRTGRIFGSSNGRTRGLSEVKSSRDWSNSNRHRPNTGRAPYASFDTTYGLGARGSQEAKNSRGWPDNDRDSVGAGRKKAASLGSSIGHGIRRPQDTGDTERLRNDRNDRRGPETRPREYTKWKDCRNKSPEVEFDEDEFVRTGNFRALPREHQRFASVQRSPNPRNFSALNKSRPAANHDSAPDSQRQRRPRRPEVAAPHKATDQNPERVREHVKVPDTIPYTTPASEFIYGTAAVEAALRCSRRQLYKLYIYQAADEELSVAKVTLRKLAFSKNVKVKMAFAEWDRLLDKMSAGRPHNGCVLEASPLPRTPVQALKTVNLEEKSFQLELAPQTREEALVNGMNDRIAINRSFTEQQKRQPIVLMLDGIVDPGNLGAIIRSAYYLGADALVFAGRNSAPLTPVTIKSSAGAAESMSLLEVKNEVDFIQRSKANGWRFYAADAPNVDSTYVDQVSNNRDESIGHSPSVIMMGNEGSGLSNHIRSQADSVVSIPGAWLIPGVGASSDPARIDSLNVSVASALLMEKFLRVPLAVSAVPRKDNSRR
ncbi:hypothetical protein BJY01DRAFT_201492 [Aspergillus pseudoustus]|uniref:rRNA methyltransferase 1, mitochondrial n=1 Tax=Aspergillus pseudoustus TaxID=1810923 RepID=A0ABR4L0N5_9EURO